MPPTVPFDNPTGRQTLIIVAVQGVCEILYMSSVVCKDILEESVIAQQISRDD